MAPTWTDASGKALADYPRPSLAVDTAVLTVPDPGTDDARLHVLVHRRHDDYRTGDWSLPGTFLHPRERLADAVLRSLRDKAGLHGQRPTQLAVLDDPDRDDRGWVLSVAHVDLVPHGRVAHLLGADVALAPVTGTDPSRLRLPGRQRRLPFDHDHIVDLAVRWARRRYADSPDPGRLLPAPFTLRDVRLLHDAVAGTAHQKDTFRRHMEPQLTPTGQRRVAVGKPAMLYRH